MKRLLLVLCIIVAGCERGAREPETRPGGNGPQKHEAVFLHVRIPDPVTPLERAEKYEDPLNEFLVAQGLGEVTGGGTMLTKANEIEYVGLDVDVHDPEKAIPLIVQKLKELGVPEGTVIEQSEPVQRVIKVK